MSFRAQYVDVSSEDELGLKARLAMAGLYSRSRDAPTARGAIAAACAAKVWRNGYGARFPASRSGGRDFPF
jgi:hypothetical protein